jgi:hypothetical protein
MSADGLSRSSQLQGYAHARMTPQKEKQC